MVSSCSGGYDVLNSPYFGSVFKFGPDSFYNWETDNLPISDLEGRTDYLLQTAGQVSATTGVTMVLSSTADESNSVYDSIGDIVARIPKKVTYPILVEICKYGNLGKLELNNIVCEGDGCLEIVNRNFAYEHAGKNIANNAYPTAVSAQTHFPWGSETFATKIKAIQAMSSIVNASSTRIAKNCFVASGWNAHKRAFWSLHTKSEHVFGEPTFLAGSSLLEDTTFFGSTTHAEVDYVFSGYPYGGQHDSSVSSMDASPSSQHNGSLLGSTKLRSLVTAPTAATAASGSPFMMYGNYFSSISINGCQGDYIKLSQLCVDGYEETKAQDGAVRLAHKIKHTNDVGVDINNSRIRMSSMFSCRNRIAGYRVRNSNVLISSGVVGYRNYPLLDGARTRVGQTDPWQEYSLFDDTWDGVGFWAKNSIIEFDSVDLSTNVPASVAGGKSPGKFAYWMCSNGSRGWNFINCEVHGGIGGHSNVAKAQGAGVSDNQTTQLMGSFNYEDGISFENSKVKYGGLLRGWGNQGNGVVVDSTNLKCMGAISELNGGVGLHVTNNSNFQYNWNWQRYHVGYVAGVGTSVAAFSHKAGQSTETPAVCVTKNAMNNLRVDGASRFYGARMTKSPAYAGTVGGRGYDSGYAMFGLDGFTNQTYATSQAVGYGCSAAASGNTPMVVVTDGSYGEFVSLAGADGCADGLAADGLVPFSGTVKGRVLSVTKNSTADLYGTSAFGTCMYNNFTAYNVANVREGALIGAWRRSAVYAGKNSSINFAGPTKISGFGVGCLAEDNSTISFDVAKDNKTGVVDDYRWGIYTDAYQQVSGNSNHTKAEIHALRSCLVANNQSTISLKNLGGSGYGDSYDEVPDWITASGNNDIKRSVDNDYRQESSLGCCTSGGHMQFYPNGFTLRVLSPGTIGTHELSGFLGAGANNIAGLKDGVAGYLSATVPAGRRTRTVGLDTATVFAGNVNNQDGLTTGGMCVRAVGGSTVLADRVNFPMGVAPSSVSGAYYNIDGIGSEQTYGYMGSSMTASVSMPDTDVVYGASSLQDGGAFGGSRIHIWNIADTSRIKASNLCLSGIDPSGVGGEAGDNRVIGTGLPKGGYHGPAGKWFGNWGPLDYYGADGEGRFQINASGGVSAGQAHGVAVASRPAATSYGNNGPFRLMFGICGDLVGASELEASANPTFSGNGPTGVSANHLMHHSEHLYRGGSPVAQLNSQGYASFGCTFSSLYETDPTYRSLVEQFGAAGTVHASEAGDFREAGQNLFGMPILAEYLTTGPLEKDYARYNEGRRFYNTPVEDSYMGNRHLDHTNMLSQLVPNFPIPPINMDWQGYLRNFLDETAIDVFANARHCAGTTVKLLSVYRNHTSSAYGGEGRDHAYNRYSHYGAGVRSVNMFDLEGLI